MGWFGEQYAEMRYTLSQRKTWEIVTAVTLLFLAAVSVVFCFVFTLVIPPGQDNSGTSVESRDAHDVVPMLFRRAADPPVPDVDLRQKFASGAGIDEAQFCIQLGSEIIDGGGSGAEAASETMMCLGVVNVPRQDTLTRLEKDLSIALTEGNAPGAMKTLIKMIHYSIIDEAR